MTNTEPEYLDDAITVEKDYYDNIMEMFDNYNYDNYNYDKPSKFAAFIEDISSKMSGTYKLANIEGMSEKQKYVIYRLEKFVRTALEKNVTLSPTPFILIGTMYEAEGNIEKAILMFSDAEKRIKKTKSMEFAYILSRMGKLKELQSKHKESIEYYLKSMEIYRKSKQWLESGRVSANIADIYLYGMKNHNDSIPYYKLAIEFFDRAEIESEKYDVYLSLSSAYNEKSDFRAAFKELENALALVENRSEKWDIMLKMGELSLNNNKINEALRIYGSVYEKSDIFHKKLLSAAGLGDVYERRGNYSQAMKYYRFVLKNIRHIKNPVIRFKFLNNTGNLYRRLGFDSKAMKCFEKSLRIADSHNLNEEKGAVYGNMGNVYYSRGNLSQAVVYFEKAMKFDTMYDVKRNIASYRTNLALVYRDSGEIKKATGIFKDALKMAEELEDYSLMAVINGYIGNIFLENSDIDRALQYFREGVEYSIKSGNERIIAYRYMDMAMVNLGTKNIAESKINIKRAIIFFEKVGDSHGLSVAYSIMGNIMRAGESIKISEEKCM